MKSIYILFLTAFLITSCTTDSSVNDANLVESETFEMKLGSKKVYGVRMQLKPSGEQTEFLGYEVQFYQDDKVWIDTVLTELTPGDTLETEVIFSQSQVNPNSSVSFKTKSFQLES
jgi:hypothetical protein